MHLLPAITRNTALFFDFDGTLADIAPRPELAHVTPELIACLRQWHERQGGALAIVTGRSLADVDRLLHPLPQQTPLAVAAEHGALLRLADGSLEQDRSPELAAALHDARACAETLARAHPGLQIELKQSALSLHYRHAPGEKLRCRTALLRAIAPHPALQMLEGKYVFDLKPAGVDKGRAIERLMQTAPCQGRIPLFAGDDTTDETGFAAVQAVGGAGIKVGPGATVARHRCASPRELRTWLQQSLAHFDQQALPPLRPVHA